MNTPLNQNEAELVRALEQLQARPTQRFYTRMRTSPWSEEAHDAPVKAHLLQWVAPVALVLTLLLLCVTFVASTPVQAWTQELLSLFRREQTDVQVNAPVQSESITRVPVLTFPSLAAAQAEIDYHLWVPAGLPSGYTLQEIRYEQDSQETHLVYRYSASHLLHFTQRPLNAEEADASLGIGASARVETVSVGETRGEYVEGAWFGTNPGDPLAWQAEETVRALRWQQAGMLFTLMATGALAEPGSLRRDELVAQAETLMIVDVDSPSPPTLTPMAATGVTQPQFFVRLATDQRQNIQPDSADPNPYAQTSGLSVEEASTLAGYAIHTPGYVPEGFHRVELVYIPDTMSVYQVYQLDEDQEKIVILGQHPTQAALPSNLEIGTNAVVKQVMVNQSRAELVQGSWVSEEDEVPVPGTEVIMHWDSEIAYFQLVWESAGFVYTLQHGGSPMWHLDIDTLIQIARSLP